MDHIRPYKVFELLKAPPKDRIASVMLPTRRGAGGTSLLETMLLIAACRLVDARRVFEFGTFMGTNTLNLASNIPDDGEVFTLDLPDAGFIQHDADAPLARMHVSATSMDFSGTFQERKIRAMTGNSRTFDFSPWKNSIDMSFIDGGHDKETAKADTESALTMSRTDRPSCIAWHDYGNREYPELTAYLEDLSHSRHIVHIEDTMLCLSFSWAVSL